MAPPAPRPSCPQASREEQLERHAAELPKEFYDPAYDPVRKVLVSSSAAVPHGGAAVASEGPQVRPSGLRECSPHFTPPPPLSTHPALAVRAAVK
jgi:hypothetical protein